MKRTCMKMIGMSLFAALLFLGTSCGGASGAKADRELADRILNDTLMERVETMALDVVRGGFTAGSVYPEVWIRDYNTFIELAMEVLPDSLVRDNLLTFFSFQDENGGIPDGFVDAKTAEISYEYIRTPLEPRYVAYKNTVETDQESSLVQAICKYVNKSGNRAFLTEAVNGRTVLARMQQAMEFLLSERYDTEYGLLWGATTADWGDVQPEHPWGVKLDESSHLCIDIYDNAFFVVALNYLIGVLEDPAAIAHWTEVRDSITANVATHLWDSEKEKYIPHVYLAGSPFPEDFDESEIYYHGGTAVAIEAGFLTKEQIAEANARMVANVEASGAPTIGLTLYPPYPEDFFQNPSMYPYGYQNGGDWTWFGGRMISRLVRNGFVREAYDEVRPMLLRVVGNDGFYEWYGRDGTPSGSKTFRGEAGVLYTAIQDFRAWAQACRGVSTEPLKK